MAGHSGPDLVLPSSAGVNESVRRPTKALAQAASFTHPKRSRWNWPD